MHIQTEKIRKKDKEDTFINKFSSRKSCGQKALEFIDGGNTGLLQRKPIYSLPVKQNNFLSFNSLPIQLCGGKNTLSVEINDKVITVKNKLKQVIGDLDFSINNKTFIEDEKEEIAALFSGYNPGDNFFEIVHVEVNKYMRGQGIGMVLMHAAALLAAESGLNVMYVGNSIANDYYLKTGFQLLQTFNLGLNFAGSTAHIKETTSAYITGKTKWKLKYV